MKELIAHTEHVTLTTKNRYEILDITDRVDEVRKRAGLHDGFILVSTMHITASIFVNDHESGLWRDIMQWLEELAARSIWARGNACTTASSTVNGPSASCSRRLG
jgi:thiamine phosphate synthase YjbQ (UPF0047 family)